MKGCFRRGISRRRSLQVVDGTHKGKSGIVKDIKSTRRATSQSLAAAPVGGAGTGSFESERREVFERSSGEARSMALSKVTRGEPVRGGQFDEYECRRRTLQR